ncbi:MAG: hypothetical protein QXY52_03325 [Conexivisphaerales archaeon]
MTYRDPHVEGVVGTRPKDGTHWAYQYGNVVISKLILAVTPIGNGKSRAQHLKQLFAIELGIKVNLLLLATFRQM